MNLDMFPMISSKLFLSTIRATIKNGIIDINVACKNLPVNITMNIFQNFGYRI